MPAIVEQCQDILVNNTIVYIAAQKYTMKNSSSYYQSLYYLSTARKVLQVVVLIVSLFCAANRWPLFLVCYIINVTIATYSLTM